MTSNMPMHTLVSINLCGDSDDTYLLFMHTKIVIVSVELAKCTLCVQCAPIPRTDHPAKASAAMLPFIHKKWLTFPLNKSQEPSFVYM